MAKSNSYVSRSAGTLARQRREYWRELLGRWQAGGLSQAAFCRRQGIPLWKFCSWKQRLVRLAVRHPKRVGRPALRAGRPGGRELAMMLEGLEETCVRRRIRLELSRP